MFPAKKNSFTTLSKISDTYVPYNIVVEIGCYSNTNIIEYGQRGVLIKGTKL
jgi:hypothetical protein